VLIGPLNFSFALISKSDVLHVACQFWCYFHKKLPIEWIFRDVSEAPA
jgi:hypothetical protein